MKKLSLILGVLAIVLSNVMCAVVAFNYCDLMWGAKYAGYSVPTSTAFLYAIPYVVGIVVCIVLACVFFKKCNNNK